MLIINNELEKEIWKLVKTMNEIWTKDKNTDELKKYFHKDMIVLINKNKSRIEGQDKCIEHWKKCSEKKIHSWEEYNSKIHVYGENRFAIVAYSFSMSYENNGKTEIVKGEDIFSLINEEGKWLIIGAAV